MFSSLEGYNLDKAELVYQVALIHLHDTEDYFVGLFSSLHGLGEVELFYEVVLLKLQAPLNKTVRRNKRNKNRQKQQPSARRRPHTKAKGID